jgi:hypothetical protein
MRAGTGWSIAFGLTLSQCVRSVSVVMIAAMTMAQHDPANWPSPKLLFQSSTLRRLSSAIRLTVTSRAYRSNRLLVAGAREVIEQLRNAVSLHDLPDVRISGLRAIDQHHADCDKTYHQNERKEHLVIHPCPWTHQRPLRLPPMRLPDSRDNSTRQAISRSERALTVGRAPRTPRDLY